MSSSTASDNGAPPFDEDLVVVTEENQEEPKETIEDAAMTDQAAASTMLPTLGDDDKSESPLGGSLPHNYASLFYQSMRALRTTKKPPTKEAPARVEQPPNEEETDLKPPGNVEATSVAKKPTTPPPSVPAQVEQPQEQEEQTQEKDPSNVKETTVADKIPASSSPPKPPTPTISPPTDLLEPPTTVPIAEVEINEATATTNLDDISTVASQTIIPSQHTTPNDSPTMSLFSFHAEDASMPEDELQALAEQCARESAPFDVSPAQVDEVVHAATRDWNQPYSTRSVTRSTAAASREEQPAMNVDHQQGDSSPSAAFKAAGEQLLRSLKRRMTLKNSAFVVLFLLCVAASVRLYTRPARAAVLAPQAGIETATNMETPATDSLDGPSSQADAAGIDTDAALNSDENGNDDLDNPADATNIEEEGADKEEASLDEPTTSVHAANGKEDIVDKEEVTIDDPSGTIDVADSEGDKEESCIDKPFGAADAAASKEVVDQDKTELEVEESEQDDSHNESEAKAYHEKDEFKVNASSYAAEAPSNLDDTINLVGSSSPKLAVRMSIPDPYLWSEDDNKQDSPRVLATTQIMTVFNVAIVSLMILGGAVMVVKCRSKNSRQQQQPHTEPHRERRWVFVDRDPMIRRLRRPRTAPVPQAQEPHQQQPRARRRQQQQQPQTATSPGTAPSRRQPRRQQTRGANPEPVEHDAAVPGLDDEDSIMGHIELDNYTYLRFADLQLHLRARGLKTSGKNKATLIKRLVEDYHQELTGLTYRELQIRLKAAELKQTGKKADLIVRLLEAGF